MLFRWANYFKNHVAYRSTIARDILGLLKGRIVYYESITIVTKHIYRIVIQSLLRHTIFNLIYAPYIVENIWDNVEQSIEVDCDLFGLDYVLVFLTESISVLTV